MGLQRVGYDLVTFTSLGPQTPWHALSWKFSQIFVFPEFKTELRSWISNRQPWISNLSWSEVEWLWKQWQNYSVKWRWWKKRPRTDSETGNPSPICWWKITLQPCSSCSWKFVPFFPTCLYFPQPPFYSLSSKKQPCYKRRYKIHIEMEILSLHYWSFWESVAMSFSIVPFT